MRKLLTIFLLAAGSILFLWKVGQNTSNAYASVEISNTVLDIGIVGKNSESKAKADFVLKNNGSTQNKHFRTITQI